MTGSNRTAFRPQKSFFERLQVIEFKIDIHQARIFRDSQESRPECCRINQRGEYATMNDTVGLQVAVAGIKLYDGRVQCDGYKLHGHMIWKGAVIDDAD